MMAGSVVEESGCQDDGVGDPVRQGGRISVG